MESLFGQYFQLLQGQFQSNRQSIIIIIMRDCVIYFHVICRTSYGEEVRVAGNHPALGRWELERSLCLTTEDQHYPRWKSTKKIVITKNYNLEFKVWIAEQGKFKRWENFSCGLNRQHNVYLRCVRLVIVADSSEIIEEHREKYVVSEEMYIEKVKRFNSNELINDEENSSSSCEGPDAFDRDDDNFSSLPSFNLDNLVGAFKQITTRAETLEIKKESCVDNERIATTRKQALHVITEPLVTPDISVPYLTIDSTSSQDSNRHATDITSKMDNFGQCFVFHELEMCSIIREIRKEVQSQNCYQLALMISSFDRQRLGFDSTKEDLVEAVTLCNGLIFTCIEVLNGVLDLMEEVGLTFKIRCLKLGIYLLTTLDRPIVIRVIEPSQQYSFDFMDFHQIHPDSIIKKRIENIRSTEQDSMHSNIIVFSLDDSQSFHVLIQNREIISLLCETHLVYALTPTRLVHHSETIALFPKILFISYTHLEMQYNNISKTIDEPGFDAKLRAEIQRTVYMYPLCSYGVQNNVVVIRNTDTSSLGLKAFERLHFELRELISQTKWLRLRKQQKCEKINSCRIEIRQTFRSKMFFTKLILQTEQSRIDFILVLMTSRFEDFQFLRLMKSLVSQTYYMTSVFAYVLGAVKNRHCCNLSKKELGQILQHLQENEAKRDPCQGSRVISRRYLF